MLTAEGVKQAEALAKRIKESVLDCNPRKIKLLVTPRIRTWETASYIAKAMDIQDIRSTAEETTPGKELAAMVSSQWPRTDTTLSWVATILVAHQPNLETLPFKLGEMLEVSFPKYEKPRHGFAVLIDTQAKTCDII